MKKLKLKNLANVGNVLTSEELKHVYGGIGSGGNGSGGSGYACTLICTYSGDPLNPIPYETIDVIAVYSLSACLDACLRKNHSMGYSGCDAVYEGNVYELCGVYNKTL